MTSRNESPRRVPALLAGMTALVATLLPGSAAAQFLPNHLYCGTSRGQIVEVSPDGEVLRTLVAANDQTEVRGLTFGPDGRLYASLGSDEVVAVDGDGATENVLTGFSGAAGGIAFDQDGRLLVMRNNGVSTLDSFGSEGSFNLNDVNEASARGLAVAPDGNLWITANDNDANERRYRLYQFDATRQVLNRSELNQVFNGPTGGIDITPAGDIWLAQPGEGFLRRAVVEDSGLTLETLDNNAFQGPNAVLLGPNGNLFVADDDANAVFELTTDGALVNTIDAAALEDVLSLAFAPFVLKGSLAGRLGAQNRVPGKAKSKQGLLSLSPGSGTIMYQMPGAADAVAAALGTRALVFHGFEIFENERSNKRIFMGSSARAPTTTSGTGQITLEVKGRVDAAGHFAIKKVKGAIQRATSVAAFQGVVKGNLKGGRGRTD